MFWSVLTICVIQASTCSDLWSLVYDHDCSAVVVLCNPTPGVSNVSLKIVSSTVRVPCLIQSGAVQSYKYLEYEKTTFKEELCWDALDISLADS